MNEYQNRPEVEKTNDPVLLLENILKLVSRHQESHL